MPIIDQVSSVAALARNMRDAIPDNAIGFYVENAASLRLVLDTYISIAVPPWHEKTNADAARTVQQMLLPVSTALKDREERNQAEQDRVAAKREQGLERKRSLRRG